MIPYVISEAHPDYKRPFVSQEFGVVKEEEIDTFFLKKICDFVLEHADIHYLNCCNDVEDFFETYYSEFYMGNSPWDARVFKNGEWDHVIILNETIWEQIQLMKLDDDMVKKNKGNSSMTIYKPQPPNYDEYLMGLDLEEETNKYEGDQYQRGNNPCQETFDRITGDMLQFLEEVLIENPLPDEFVEEFKQLSSTDKMVYLFRNSSSSKKEQFMQNRNMFSDCIDICIKGVQDEMDHMTEFMHQNDMIEATEEQISERIEHLMTLYSQLLILKESFNL